MHSRFLKLAGKIKVSKLSVLTENYVHTARIYPVIMFFVSPEIFCSMDLGCFSIQVFNCYQEINTVTTMKCGILFLLLHIAEKVNTCSVPLHIAVLQNSKFRMLKLFFSLTSVINRCTIKFWVHWYKNLSFDQNYT